MNSGPNSSGKRGAEQYFRPEDQEEFRLAQLLLLLEIANLANLTPSIERLGVLDFFAANPFLVVQPKDDEYRDLILAGFSVKPLTYASPGHRFVTRRSRLQSDLALLVAYGFAIPATNAGYRVFRISETGNSAARQLSSIYAQAYRASAGIITKHVRKVPDSKLPEFCHQWLQADPAMLDLLNI